MQYTILVYETESQLAARTDPKRKDAYWGAYRAYTKALRDAGVMVGGAGLEPRARPRRCGYPTARGACRTGRSPTRRSSSAATT
jgi:hypothetical protein